MDPDKQGKVGESAEEKQAKQADAQGSDAAKEAAREASLGPGRSCSHRHIRRRRLYSSCFVIIGP